MASRELETSAVVSILVLVCYRYVDRLGRMTTAIQRRCNYEVSIRWCVRLAGSEELPSKCGKVKAFSPRRPCFEDATQRERTCGQSLTTLDNLSHSYDPSQHIPGIAFVNHLAREE